MRYLLLISSLLLAGSLHAEGLINLSNSASTATHISVNSTVGGAATGQIQPPANSYYFALFWSNTGNVHGSTTAIIPTPGNLGNYVMTDVNWKQAGPMAENTATQGRIADVNNPDVVPGVPGCSSAYFVLIGWSANIGSTVNALEAWIGAGGPFTAWIGESIVPSSQLPLGDGGPCMTPIAMGATGGTIPGFVLGKWVPPAPTSANNALSIGD